MLQGQAKEKKNPLEKYGNASRLPATLDMETAGGKWDLYHWNKEKKMCFFFFFSSMHSLIWAKIGAEVYPVWLSSDVRGWSIWENSW